MIRVNLLESVHHLNKRVFVVGNFIGFRKTVFHPKISQLFFQLSTNDVPEGHRGGTDLGPDNLELAGDNLRFFSYGRMPYFRDQVWIFGYSG